MYYSAPIMLLPLLHLLYLERHHMAPDLHREGLRDTEADMAVVAAMGITHHPTTRMTNAERSFAVFAVSPAF